MTTFTQIIFPQKPKSTVTFVGDVRSSLLFSMIFCTKKDDWVSMLMCLRCKCAERTLEEIMSDNLGC